MVGSSYGTLVHAVLHGNVADTITAPKIVTCESGSPCDSKAAAASTYSNSRQQLLQLQQQQQSATESSKLKHSSYSWSTEWQYA